MILVLKVACIADLNFHTQIHSINPYDRRMQDVDDSML